MYTITDISASEKSAYRRPYKTRGQRRETARRQHDERADHKFLVRAALVIGVVLLVAVGVAIKGLTDPDATALTTMQAPR